MSDPDPGLFIPLQKNAMDIWRFAACWEYTAASFRYQFQTQLIEEVYEIGIEEPGKGLSEKRASFTEMRNKVGYFCYIRDIAAAFSGNTKLEAGPFHFFKQKGIRSCFSGLPCSHKSRRAAADDNYSSCLHIQWYRCLGGDIHAACAARWMCVDRLTDRSRRKASWPTNDPCPEAL